MNRCGLWMAALFIAGAAVAAAQDMDTSYQNLQDAVAKLGTDQKAQAGADVLSADVAAVKKLAAETSALARQAKDSISPSERPDSGNRHHA